jgi:hypothetical protein
MRRFQAESEKRLSERPEVAVGMRTKAYTEQNKNMFEAMRKNDETRRPMLIPSKLENNQPNI